MSKWYPIESAPSGKLVLVRQETGHITLGVKNEKHKDWECQAREQNNRSSMKLVAWAKVPEYKEKQND